MGRHIYIDLYMSTTQTELCVVCVSVCVHVTVSLCVAARLSNEKAAGEKEDKVGPCQPHTHTQQHTQDTSIHWHYGRIE